MRLPELTARKLSAALMVRFQLSTLPAAISKLLPWLFLGGLPRSRNVLGILNHASASSSWTSSFTFRSFELSLVRCLHSFYNLLAGPDFYKHFPEAVLPFQTSNSLKFLNHSRPLFDHDEDGTYDLCCCGSADPWRPSPSCRIH